MNQILCYLRDKRKTILGGLFCIGISMLVQFLFNIPARAILYSGELCLIVWVLFGLVSFWNYGNIKKQRDKIANLVDGDCVDLSILDNLRTGEKQIDRDYMGIIDCLIKKNTEQINQVKDKQQEDKDYLMCWVHQIKTPITAINLMLQQEDTKESRELMDEMMRIQEYVENMLQYTRIDTLNQDFVLGRCSLEDVIHQVVRYDSRLFISKHLRVDVEPIPYEVVSDEKWLVFVLKQIVSNAIKYTRTGEVRFDAEKTEKGIALQISDTGVGISPEDLPRIFEKAYTGYNGHMDRKATGIGLFLTKKVLDKLGHDIVITSEVGKGTTVTITFEDWEGHENKAITPKTL